MNWFDSMARAARSGDGAKRCAIAALLVTLQPAAAADGVGPFAVELKGKAFDERCITLKAGESIRYAFRSTAPVEFNIHYHRGSEVFYPVRKSAARDDRGSFTAREADTYCLMWQQLDPAASATVDGSLDRSAGG